MNFLMGYHIFGIYSELVTAPSRNRKSINEKRIGGFLDSQKEIILYCRL